MGQPNGVRLSCAAKGCLSQMQFYYEGRRQLEPLVRLRTEIVASIHPCPDARLPRHRRLNRRGSPDGRMERRSELISATAPARHETFTTWLVRLNTT